MKTGNGVKYIADFPNDFYKSGKSDVEEVTAMFAAEIGGVNSFEPIIVGAMMDLPIVDADGMGRAFPEIQVIAIPTVGICTCAY